jgi:hypothetical protein
MPSHDHDHLQLSQGNLLPDASTYLRSIHSTLSHAHQSALIGRHDFLFPLPSGFHECLQLIKLEEEVARPADLGHWVKGELKGRNDPEIGSTASDAEEQLALSIVYE